MKQRIIVAVLIVAGALLAAAPQVVEAGGRWCPHC